MILLGCLGVLLLIGMAERLALARARRAVPIRVHVNGTRGKSTVTRLVAAALREAGVPTLAKVTGTEPRLILPDGSERTIRRLAPATIREQAWLLRQARRHGARALVAECMAVRPDLQWTSEREILQSTHGVITNVRLDHTDVMGGSLDAIARALANTVPRRGVLITGDRRAAAILEERCADVGCRLIVADGRPDGTAGDGAHGVSPGEAIAQISPDPVCLAVARELGIDEATARRGMERAAADPGAATSGTAVVAGRRVNWLRRDGRQRPGVHGFAGRGLGRRDGQGRWGRWDRQGRWMRSRAGRAGGLLCVYNHREDRPERLATFGRASRMFAAAERILVTGDRPSLMLMRGVRRTCRADVRFVSPRRLAGGLEGALLARPYVTRLVYCGNTRGFVRPFSHAETSMLEMAIGIGITVNLLLTELFGLASAGLVVPGYLALYLAQPARLLATAVLAVLTWGIVKFGLARVVVLYGRRRFGVTILVGFLLNMLLLRVLRVLPSEGLDLRAIGFIIPGLIANQALAQGLWPTLIPDDACSGHRAVGASARRGMAAVSGPFRPRIAIWPARLVVVAALAAVALTSALALGPWPASVDALVPRDVLSRAKKLPGLSQRAERVIAEARRAEGVASGLDDGTARSSLLGAELTPLTTTLGSVEAKRISTNPRWARALVVRCIARGCDAAMSSRRDSRARSLLSTSLSLPRARDSSCQSSPFRR